MHYREKPNQATQTHTMQELDKESLEDLSAGSCAPAQAVAVSTFIGAGGPAGGPGAVAAGVTAGIVTAVADDSCYLL